MHGDIMAALAGGENVYYYGGPGLRYFRALEMILFGDTNLGYLSLVLVMPIVVLGLFKRFLSATLSPGGWRWSSSSFRSARSSAPAFSTMPNGRRAASPIRPRIFCWSGACWWSSAPREGPPNRVANAAAGALLLALAVFTKPIVAPMAGIVLGGAGLAALATGQWRRLAGLCIGFLPVLLMPLHNWVFGHGFVLLSTNANLPILLVMPPSAWLAALAELLHLDFSGAHLHARAGADRRAG